MGAGGSQANQGVGMGHTERSQFARARVYPLHPAHGSESARLSTTFVQLEQHVPAACFRSEHG